MITLVNPNTKGYGVNLYRGLEADGFPTGTRSKSDNYQVMDTGKTYVWNVDSEQWDEIVVPRRGAEFANGSDF